MLTQREKFLIVLTMCFTFTFALLVLTFPMTAILTVFLILKHLLMKLTKFLYGDNYDHSHYEKILHWLHDVKKVRNSLLDILTNVLEFHKKE